MTDTSLKRHRSRMWLNCVLHITLQKLKTKIYTHNEGKYILKIRFKNKVII